MSPFRDPIHAEDILGGQLPDDVIARRLATIPSGPTGASVVIADNRVSFPSGDPVENAPGYLEIKRGVLDTFPTLRLRAPEDVGNPSNAAMVTMWSEAGSPQPTRMQLQASAIELLTGSAVVQGNKILTAADQGAPLTQILAASCQTNLDLTAVEADVPGATVSVTTARPGARFVCFGSFYFSAIAANINVASGKLAIDGVNRPEVANFTGSNTVPDRGNCAQIWSGTLAAAGAHTLKLRGVLGGTPPQSGTRINTASTTLTVLVFE